MRGIPHAQQRAITDGLVELLIQIVHKILSNAERKVVRELLHDFSRVHGKDRLLGRIAEASLGNPDGTIREVLYPLVGEDVLINLLREYKSSGPAYTKKVHTVVRTSYGGHYRRMLPGILNVLTLRCNNARYRPILEALDWVRRHRDLNRRHIWLDEGVSVDLVAARECSPASFCLGGHVPVGVPAPTGALFVGGGRRLRRTGAVWP